MYKFILPILMLTISNVFMTFAWYGHLKFKTSALWLVILVSWGIAFFEYCFQVPANRIGHEVYNAVQLKTIQEVITLIVFSGFSIWYLKEEFRWNYLIGFVFIVLAVLFIFKKQDIQQISESVALFLFSSIIIKYCIEMRIKNES